MNFENFNSDTNKLNRTNFTFFFYEKADIPILFLSSLGIAKNFVIIFGPQEAGYRI